MNLQPGVNITDIRSKVARSSGVCIANLNIKLNFTQYKFNVLLFYALCAGRRISNRTESNVEDP